MTHTGRCFFSSFGLGLGWLITHLTGLRLLFFLESGTWNLESRNFLCTEYGIGNLSPPLRCRTPSCFVTLPLLSFPSSLPSPHPHTPILPHSLPIFIDTGNTFPSCRCFHSGTTALSHSETEADKPSLDENPSQRCTDKHTAQKILIFKFKTCKYSLPKKICFYVRFPHTVTKAH